MSKGLEALKEIKKDLSQAQQDYLNIFQNCNFANVTYASFVCICALS